MTGKDGVRRYSMFFAGVPICAAGIALITRAGLGTSPISSIPFVLSLITPPTMGVYTFVFNMLFLACVGLPRCRRCRSRPRWCSAPASIWRWT